ncbi:transmembrane protein 170A-like [Phyllostomus discolor]|uniref:Transmembrane protein 170A-like n=1 Tax=Phyllostomus discolor TaxID=89673 RepID=A0A6J2NDH1_9CHIR|nr:transmembrane protein 170A-like [Phyllostomus discolor]
MMDWNRPVECWKWYGVFRWVLVSSLLVHVHAELLTCLPSDVAGVCLAAAGKEMIPFEALALGLGQMFCVVVVSFLQASFTL